MEQSRHEITRVEKERADAKQFIKEATDRAVDRLWKAKEREETGLLPPEFQ